MREVQPAGAWPGLLMTGTCIHMRILDKQPILCLRRNRWPGDERWISIFQFDWKHLSKMKEINRWSVFLPIMIFLFAE